MRARSRASHDAWVCRRSISAGGPLRLLTRPGPAFGQRRRFWSRGRMTMKASIWSVILVALLGMPASATAPNSEFRCQGLFVRDASRASFIKAFGPANVAREDVFMAGDTVPMTVVFPRDRRRWRDMASERGIAKVIIGGGSTWSVGGIVIGPRLSTSRN